MTGSACNQGAGAQNPTQSTLCQPADLAVDAANTRLFVTDNQNNRVLVFNYSGGFSNGMNASYVLGQSNFTNGGSNTTRSGFSGPQGLAYDAANTRLFVADAVNDRVLVLNVATGTIANGESASHVFGASSLTSAGSGSCTASTFNNPNGVAYDPNHGTQFVGAANGTDNRVLAFNATPAYIANGENTSWALGTTSVASCPNNCGNGPTQNNLCIPVFLNYDPGSSRLFVIDSGNERVMIFDGGYAPPNFMKMLPD